VANFYQKKKKKEQAEERKKRKETAQISGGQEASNRCQKLFCRNCKCLVSGGLDVELTAQVTLIKRPYPTAAGPVGKDVVQLQDAGACLNSGAGNTSSRKNAGLHANGRSSHAVPIKDGLFWAVPGLHHLDVVPMSNG
jgi:hypothetical protein